MELENHLVRIIADWHGYQATVELSILQLAKIFGTDGEVIRELGFGNEEYESRCDETRACVERFPNIQVADRELEFGSVTVTEHVETKPGFVQILAEDIVGWDNEGMSIEVPRVVFDQLKGGFRVFVRPFSVVLRAR